MRVVLRVGIVPTFNPSGDTQMNAVQALPLSGSLARKLMAHALVPSMNDAHAVRVEYAAANPVGQPLARMYRDTPHRAQMRQLLDAAGLTGATVKVAFFKESDELRYMVCRPVPSADYTRKYVTVLDLEATEAMGEGNQYRRIGLDSITGLEISYRAGDAA
jgi:hypothetical protein